MIRRLRWVVCIFPPMAWVVFEETPGLSGLDGINAAGLIVMSPIFLAAGFGITAAIIGLSRWIFRRLRLRSRAAFALLALAIVGVLSPLAYLGGDWLQFGTIELASLPAALLLSPGRAAGRR